MRTSGRIFLILTIFFIIVGIAYGIITGTRAPLGIETVGFPAFIMLAGLTGLIAVTLFWAARKFPNRPEEDLHAEVADDAGVQGSFAPYSWWPLWAAIGAAMAFLGVAAGWWIAGIGAVFVVVGVVGWVMEFSSGPHAH
ncbi:cytochrome c oxidase subunit 4 [Brachybacterium sp. JHP9]|uniref:Cytochrome c oxidase polypeptide 4 n=1 Tax=Brachybacterium equifaecis TaxID=2910770 RepID=A0ABT0R2M3_9MICO|nr:cytochrome c oxidase subunit 4 [Brachybacterium equifaecis]MCL6423484.1 cytochrome c oxidase subunit 4 [Brachybacterium equifaecis]